MNPVRTASRGPGSGAHVGDLAAALVDEQLDPQRRDQVLAHIAGCAPCYEEVDHQRRLKTRLRALGGPGLPADLLSRLNAFGGSASSGGTGGGAGLRLAAAPVPAPGPAVGTRVAARPVARRDAQRALRLLAGAASLMLVGTGTGYAAASDGQPSSPSRTITPALNARPAGGAESSRSGGTRGPAASVQREDEDGTPATGVPAPGALRMRIGDPSFARMSASLGR